MELLLCTCNIYVTAAGSFMVQPKVSRDSGWSGIPIHAWWVHKTPSLDVNRISFIPVGRTYHTDKVGDLVPQYFLSSQLGIMVYVIETNGNPQYNSEGVVMVPVYRDSGDA